MRGGAVGEQPQLLLLDAVLHLAPGAVGAVIDRLGGSLEVGDDETWVGPLVGVLDLGNHPALRFPGAGGITAMSLT